MIINILSVLAISDESERVFLKVRRTILWERAQLLIVNIKRVECLKNW
jgi:hypothetical protein